MEIYYIDNDARIEIIDRNAGIILDVQPLTPELLAAAAIIAASCPPD